MSIISTSSLNSIEPSIGGALDDNTSVNNLAITDSKNVQGSDFVRSAEPPAVVRAESLSNQQQQSNNIEAVPAPIEPIVTPAVVQSTKNASENVAKTTSKNDNGKIKPKVSSSETCPKHDSSNIKGKPKVPPRPAHLMANSSNNIQNNSHNNKIVNAPKRPNKKPPPPPPSDEDDEDVFEYKFTPRQVFICTICQFCKEALDNGRSLCPTCQMVSYCTDEHCKSDWNNHKDLCGAIQEIAKKRGKYSAIYS